MSMTQHEAASIVQLLVEYWPNPELSDDGLRLLLLAVSDTDLSLDEAQAAVRVLLGTSRFRPIPADLIEASGRNRPAYHKPFLVPALETPPLAKDVALGHVAAARAALRGEG